MRRLHITVAISVATAVLASAAVTMASSQFQQTAKITLTGAKAGASTGFKAALASTDPGEPGAKPQALRTLAITFPSGTRFNFKSKAIKPCTASEIEIKGTSGAACPAKSKIGTGSAEANGAPLFPQLPESVTAYVTRTGIIFLLVPKGPAGSVLVLHGRVSANKLSVGVPALAAGPIAIVITKLELAVSRLGAGKSSFVTAGKCTGGQFKVQASFLYWTGVKQTIPSVSKCSK